MPALFLGLETALITNPNTYTSSSNEVDPRNQQLRADLARLFSQRLHAEVPSETTDLFETGVLDSQRFVDLLLHIEQEFGIQVSIEQFEIENFRSIDSIANSILQQNLAHVAAYGS